MLSLRKIQAAAGLSLTEVPEPDAPGSGEVLVRVAATGICGTDLSVDRWTASYAGFMAQALPVTLGHETAGRIVAVGQGVDPARVGRDIVIDPAVACGRCERCLADDPVGCLDRQAVGLIRDGAFAPYVLAPDTYCYDLPANVPVELGALAEPLSVGAHALAVGGFRPGMRVVVLGPGPIGQGVAALARHLGAAQVAVLGKQDGPRLDVLRGMGFTDCFDMAEPDANRALTLAKGQGFDLAVEAAGVPEVVDQALALLRPQGVLVVAGMPERPASVDILRLVKYRLEIRGASRIPPSAWETVLRALADAPDAFAPLVTHRFPLAQADQAFRLCHGRTPSKVLLLP
ncbi:alcohol dehydrogenase catalytic domain-containing protein [Niveispirillum sp.]|uniref:zinc-dependent alcohol dehydrogenase n=1 Tax=Niveispirillum sp. TaxID=1917217 RepID=UPI001B624C93|nr:alcohol dehydrogenase catalytic domain-containing protein [Niveispirillum sp.]MBP7334378.1 alcohol dehydrogenase catalytic domain-containing protein [Niveispirillum sp.]